MKNNTKSILITASTFPRWKNDTTPPFVQQFAEHIADNFNKTYVLAPHYKGAKTKEALKKYLFIKRFRYFIPQDQQDIAYSGGALQKIQKTPLYVLKLVFFMISLLFNNLYFRLIKKTQTINAHWLIPQGFIAVIVKLLTFGKTKVVITVHGGDVFSLNGGFMKKIKRFTLKKADEVIVNSSATQDACQAIYDSREYPIIPMGIDTNKFKPKKNGTKIIDNSGYDIVCLFVGRLAEVKGVMYACKAIKKLVNNGYNPLFYIIGSGPEEFNIKEFIYRNEMENNIKLAGWVDNANLVDYYSAANIFIGPSIVDRNGCTEALGLVFIEALSCGVPVIATKTGGIGDIVTHEKNGYLVKQKSAKDIAQKIELLANDRERLNKLATSARQSIIEKFDWKNVKVRYIKYL